MDKEEVMVGEVLQLGGGQTWKVEGKGPYLRRVQFWEWTQGGTNAL